METEAKPFCKIRDSKRRMEFDIRAWLLPADKVNLVQLPKRWEIKNQSNEEILNFYRLMIMPPSLCIILNNLFSTNNFRLSPPAQA